MPTTDRQTQAINVSSGQDKGTGEVSNPGKRSALNLKFHPPLAAAKKKQLLLASVPF